MTGRLRAAPLRVPFHVVLIEPEIPQNTGNIGRLSAATGCPLHLVGRLGFNVDDRSVRRAGVDYWHLVDMRLHPNFDHFYEKTQPRRTWYLSGKADRSYLDAAFEPGDALAFGKESVGLGPADLERDPTSVIGIPTLGQVRSLNLANAVSIVLFEALRQTGALRPTYVEPIA